MGRILSSATNHSRESSTATACPSSPPVGLHREEQMGRPTSALHAAEPYGIAVVASVAGAGAVDGVRRVEREAAAAQLYGFVAVAAVTGAVDGVGSLG